MIRLAKLTIMSTTNFYYERFHIFGLSNSHGKELKSKLNTLIRHLVGVESMKMTKFLLNFLPIFLLCFRLRKCLISPVVTISLRTTGYGTSKGPHCKVSWCSVIIILLLPNVVPEPGGPLSMIKYPITQR
jgi:hypothetical protein